MHLEVGAKENKRRNIFARKIQAKYVGRGEACEPERPGATTSSTRLADRQAGRGGGGGGGVYY